MSWGSWSAASEPLVTTGGDIIAATEAAVSGAGGEAALKVTLGLLRREIWALRHMAPEQARSALRQLKRRFHPDKATKEQRHVFEEASKVINAETAGFGS